MQIKKKPVTQNVRRGVPGEIITSTSGQHVVDERHVVVGDLGDQWPVSFEYLLQNCDPADAEAEALFAEIRDALNVRDIRAVIREEMEGKA